MFSLLSTLVLVRFLQARRIVVHRPRPLSEEEEDFLSAYGRFGTQFFMRDPILVIGNHVIDVVLMGQDILVGVNREIKSASNDAGIQWLQQYLGDAYRVHAVPLTRDVLHLDDDLAPVRGGLAIIMREQLAESLPRPRHPPRRTGGRRPGKRACAKCGERADG